MNKILIQTLSNKLGLEKIPFTIITSSLMIIFAVMTNSINRELSPELIVKFGFAPVDLLQYKIFNLFLSIFITTGKAVFFESLISFIAIAGIFEYLTSSKEVIKCFFGIHVITMIILSYITFVLFLFGNTYGIEIFLSHDVGPSAGYFGILGILISLLKTPYVNFLFLCLLLIFMYLFFYPISNKNMSIEYSAAMAHIIAFTVGYKITKQSERMKKHY